MVIAAPNILLRRNEIEHNVAGIDGGGLVIHARPTAWWRGMLSASIRRVNWRWRQIFHQTSPTVRNNRFEGNIAGRTGGGIHFEDRSTPLVENNDCWYTAGRYGGAAVADLGSNPVLRYNTFVKSGLPRGGALYIHENCQVRVEHNTFIFNWAGSTGGLYAANDHESQIWENYFSHNATNDRGGAIFVRDSSLVLKGNQIIANTAQDYGGGVAMVGEGSPQVINNLIADNHAGGDGDGVYIRADVTFRNNTVARNDRNQNGDGIFVSGSSGSSLSNNLVIGNDRGIRGSQPTQLTRNCFSITARLTTMVSPQALTISSRILYSLAVNSVRTTWLNPCQVRHPPAHSWIRVIRQPKRSVWTRARRGTDGQSDQGRADIGFHYTRLPGRTQFLPMVALSD